MAKQLDQIIVVDLEATCWDGPTPEGQAQDIIEIGLTLVDVQTFECSGKRSILVQPTRSTLSPFCTKLTGITPRMLQKDGIALDEACRILRKEYGSNKRLWASWGDFDRRQFVRECRERSIKYPFGPSHINVKSLHAILLGHTRAFGARAAVEGLGYTFEGNHHRGDDDAWNIAKVMAHILKSYPRVRL